MADNACSVTVVGSRTRVDVSLPGSMPVAELLWDLADLLTEPEVTGPVHRWGLVRTGGQVLSGERGLTEQGVADGSLLFLKDLSRPPAQPVFDDYAEAVALAVEAGGGRWGAGARQAVLLAAALGWALVAAVLAVRLGDPAVRAATCFGGAGCLLLAGTLTGRRLDAGRTGALLALGALPLWAVGGMALAVRAGLSGAELYTAVGGFVTAGALASPLAGDAARAPAAGVVYGVGAAAALVAICLALGAGPVQVASVLATAALVAVRFAPTVAVRLARLGAGGPLGPAGFSPEGFRSRVETGHGLLAAMLIGAAAVMAAACVLLALEGGWFERGLVVAVALGAAAQVRHFRFSLEAAPLALASLIALGALEAAALRYLDAAPDRRPAAVALALGTALVWAGGGLIARRRQLSPLLLRGLDQLESLALLATIPLAAGSLGAYSEVAAAAQRLA
jgi:type VII secretion integral membrane protein EccD